MPAASPPPRPPAAVLLAVLALTGVASALAIALLLPVHPMVRVLLIAFDAATLLLVAWVVLRRRQGPS